VFNLRKSSAGSAGDWEAGLPSLTVKRKIPLSLLPRAKAFSTEKYRYGAAVCERPFQRLS
jgi:hypothetical protein